MLIRRIEMKLLQERWRDLWWGSQVASFVAGVIVSIWGLLAHAESPLWVELKDKEPARVSGPVELETFARLAETLSPSVVHISVEKKVPVHSFFDDWGMDPFDFFFGFPAPHKHRWVEGMGSGFIINADGYILTNNHVVEDATEVRVKLVNGNEYKAVVVGAFAPADLALCRIDAPKSELVPAPLGDSDEIRIGEWVIAIGNPFGLDHTVTAGIISAKGRKDITPGDRPTYSNFIQTDASINPGNSGGPLINMRGEVIGINTAIIASGQGISFAIPVNMAKKLLPQLYKGKVERSYLGVMIQPVTPEIAKSLGLKKAKGALVAQVLEGSPASKAGLEAGDVVLKFDHKKITHSSDLQWLAATTPAGQKVRLEVWRAGKIKKIDVILEPHPDDVASSDAKKGEAPVKAEYVEGIGIAVADPAASSREGGEGRKGVVVTAVKRGSPAERVGIRKGDLILKVNNVPVSSSEQFKALCAKVDSGEPVSFYIRRGEMLVWIALTKR